MNVHLSVRPPTLQQVRHYFIRKGISPAQALAFYMFQKARKWRTSKDCPMRNWRIAANHWIGKYKKQKRIQSFVLEVHLVLKI